MTYDGSACPEGFVLTEDEVACIPFFAEDGVCGEMEIPVLGGGCKKVGPDWGEEGEPYFDECPDGHLARKGGDCVQAGPRACPKLWALEADVDCEVGDVLPCPEGWSESEDGMYCDPMYAECPFGERALVGGACERVIPLAEDCPEGPFPEVPEGATDVMYVLAGSGCVDDCGGADAPFASIQAAVDAVPDGGSVLVGEGVYAEGLLIEKSVHVVGLCATAVGIVGVTDVGSDQTDIPVAGVAILGTGGVSISGIRIVSPAVGMVVAESQDVVLTDLELFGVVGTGLFAGASSTVTAEGLWVHDTLPPPDLELLDGGGIWVQASAEVRIANSLVECACESGLHVENGGSLLEIDGSVVRHTEPNENGKFGYGIRASDGATITALDCLLHGNATAGFAATDSGTQVALSGTVVRNTEPNNDGEFGCGLAVVQGASTKVYDSLLQGNTGQGVLAGHSDTHVMLYGTVVRETKPNESGEYGNGIQASEGATTTVSGCLLEGTRGGLVVGHSGTEVTLSGTVVRDTKLNEKGGGYAIRGLLGSTTDVSGCLLDGNRGVAVVMEDPGTQMELSDTVVRRTKPDVGGEFGLGMEVHNGANVTVSDALLEWNTSTGIAVGDSGTEATLSGTVVRDTQQNEKGKAGLGMYVVDGATAWVSSSLLQRNTFGGVYVSDSGTQVTLSGTIVRDTMPYDSGEFGHGLAVGEGATATVSTCLLEGNTTGGLMVSHSGTQVMLSGTVVRDTKQNEHGEFGYGIEVGEGAATTVSGSLVEGNSTVGVVVGHSGTEVTLSGTVVRHTELQNNGHYGYGLGVGYGAIASAYDCLVQGNTSGGVVLMHSGTQVALSRTVVCDTKHDGNEEFGYGLSVGEGATALVSGCLWKGNSYAGVVLFGAGTVTTLSGSVVRDTNPNSVGLLGWGISAMGGARASVTATLLSLNHTSGIGAWSGKTEIEVSGSAVIGTQLGGDKVEGSPQVFGDGVSAAGGATVDVISSLLVRNGRAGAYYHKAGGGLQDCIIQDNSSYGLAMHQCSEDVEYAGRLGDSPAGHGNYIFGNAFDLPADQAQQVTTTPGEMPLPDPREPMELPEVPDWDME